MTVLVAAGADVDVQDDMRSNVRSAVALRGPIGLTPVRRDGADSGGRPGHVEMVRALLDRTTVDVDHVNDLGWTALLEAVILGDGGPAHQEIVRLLVAAGADRSIGDNAGMTPRQHAQAMGFTEIVSILD